MPHYERGVYEPTDEVRVFDGSDDDEDVEGSRLPLLIVLALLVLAMFAGVVWLAYSQGVARGRTETPVIAAASGPARVAPQNPGGARQPYQGFKIYEQPAPPDDDTAASQLPAQSPAAAPPAAAAAPPVKLAAAEPKPAAPVPAPAKVEAAPAKPAPAPVTKPAPAPIVAAKPVVTAEAASKPASAPAAKPTVAAEKPQPAPLMIGPATAPPRALGTAAPAPKPVAATPAPKPVAATPAASGSYVLQIGAYKSQADADTAWKTYKAKHAALLSGYNSDVQQADLGDKGTWYRLRIAGFADKDIASALCDRLKADGGGCFLGK